MATDTATRNPENSIVDSKKLKKHTVDSTLQSRTRLGFRNSRVALFVYVSEMVLAFVSRTVFIHYIGIDVLGLNATVTNMLQMLNVAEMGISNAIAFSLYRPLARCDRQAVADIVAIQGRMYRRVGLTIIGASIVLMCFFPLIFHKMALPMWYAYASFAVMLYGEILTYFINYKQVVLTASQQEYKVLYSYKGVMVLKNGAQIAAMMTMADGYVWWLALQAIFSTGAALSLRATVNRSFPWLRHIAARSGDELRARYHRITTKIRQLFFHKIASVVLTQSSPIILYAYVSLPAVAIYGNYMLIVSALTILTQALFNGVSAGIGNLIAQGNRRHTLEVFKEVFTSRFLVASTCCFGVFFMGNSFVSLWVGPGLTFDSGILTVIVALMFVQIFRSAVEHFLQGYGMFADVWAPIVESTLNIGLSIVLGYYFGIVGVLSGVLISVLCIVCIWKPIYLFRWGLKASPWIFAQLCIVHVGVFALVAFGLGNLTVDLWPEPENFLQWGIEAIISATVFVAAEWLLLWLLVPAMRRFTRRVISLMQQPRVHPTKKV